MPTITLKNIPPDLYERLKESAAANHRSINSEVISLIERGVRGRKVDPEALLARARELRRKTRRRPAL
jgi:plasmid stability protein